MKIGKKVLALCITFTLIVSTIPSAIAAENSYPDVPSDHWANDVIAKWSGDAYGVLQGNSDGTFAPSRGLTLGELATILSKTFGFTERTPVEVIPAWADEHVEKAVAARIIAKADSIDASVEVTREQAVKYIALAYNVAPVPGNTTFADADYIDAEYKPYVNAFQQLGYVAGKGGGVFDPKAGYTRAEAMQVIENTTAEIVDNSIDGRTYAKNLIVRKSGVTVKDTTVNSNLIVGQGVGNGKVTLDNVSIGGSLIAYGGGASSITVKGGDTIASAVADKPYGEAIHLSGNFGTITVTDGTRLILTGKAAKLILLGNNESTLSGAGLDSVEVNGDNVKLIANGGSTAENVTVSANSVVISGSGTVKSVNVTANAKEGVEVLTVPTSITVDANAGAVKINNGTVQPGKTATTANTSSGGSSSGTTSTTPAVPTEPTVALSLSVSESTVLIDEGSNPLYLYLSTELAVKSIPLFEQSTKVADMYDDGNYSLHGDDIAGDGIYSAKYTNTVTEDSEFIFMAQYEGKKSNVVVVKVYMPLSDEALESISSVDSSLEDVLASEAYLSETDIDDKKEIVEESLNKLSEDGLIIADSILYSEESGIFSFLYTKGILGGVMIADFDSDMKSTDITFETEATMVDDSLELNEEQNVLTSEEELALRIKEREDTVIQPEELKAVNVMYSDYVVPDEIGTALILNAYVSFPGSDVLKDMNITFYNDLKSDWESKGLRTIIDTTVTVDDFKNLNDYEVIIFDSHGSTYKWNDGFLGLDHHRCPAICLTQKSTKDNDKKYSAELKDKQIAKVTTDGNGTCYWILPPLIQKAYSSASLDNSFVFSLTCEFMGKNSELDSSMADALTSRGAEAVVGCINSVYTMYISSFMDQYIDSLITGSTAQEAFDAAISVQGENDKEYGTSDKYPAYPQLIGRKAATLLQTNPPKPPLSNVLSYTLSEDKTEATITDCAYDATDEDIAAAFAEIAKSYSITSIGNGAFSYCDLTGITLPDSLTSIGDFAFVGCYSLTDITIPANVTSIGDDAFMYTSLNIITVDQGNANYTSDSYGVLFDKEKTVLMRYPSGNIRSNYEIPVGVTRIDNRAFQSCVTLANVTLPDGLISIGDAAFSNNYYLTNVPLPVGLTSIGDGAFASCYDLTNVTLPDSLTSIGDAAFFCCSSLTGITIPANVTSIGDGAFAYRGVYSHQFKGLNIITVDQGNANYTSDSYGVLFDKEKTLLIQYPIGNTRSKYVIPDGVKRIGVSAFSNCTSLTDITLPEGLISIGDYAFANCSSLTGITISAGVTSIGSGAFSNCNGLTDITIADGMTDLPLYFLTEDTFQYDLSLYVPGSVTSVGGSASLYPTAGATLSEKPVIYAAEGSFIAAWAAANLPVGKLHIIG